MQITRRALGPKDVLLDVLYTGICHSDVHSSRGEDYPHKLPIIPGHETIGRVLAVGKEVTKFKVGGIGGVGSLIDSCRTCVNCLSDQEQICLNEATWTFDSPDKVSGGHTFGGFSDKIVATEHFVVRIPPGADLPAMAPLLCAGITTFSPMRHWQVSRGHRIGVVGLGGLGHIALKLAVAHGAQVVVFTTSPGKIKDAFRLGASEVVLWTDTEAMQRQAGTLDWVISTVPKPFQMQPFMDALKNDATLVNVGALGILEGGLSGAAITFGRKRLSGSMVGGMVETQEVLDYCIAHNIKSDIELIRPEQINAAFDRILAKDVRYRFVIDFASAKRG